MAKVFQFLPAASTPEFLKTIREESKPITTSEKEPSATVITKEPSDAGYDSDADVIAEGEDEPDVSEEDEPEQKQIKKKKPQRRVSTSLLKMIKEYAPANIDCKTDSNCLYVFMIKAIPYIDKRYGNLKDHQNEYEECLSMLAKIIEHMYDSNTQSMRGTYVRYTGIFKKFYINNYKDENEVTGPHVDIVRRILRAERSRVLDQLAINEANLNKRLLDKYEEKYDDFVTTLRNWYEYGMHYDNSKAKAQLLLACVGSTGSRKIEIIDPHITFETYRGYMARMEAEHKPIPSMRLGAQDMNSKEDDSSIPVDRKLYEKEFGFAYTILQRGVAKDKDSAINKYLGPDDERLVPSRSVIKPCLALTAEQVVTAVERFRKLQGVTKENFESRVKEGNKINTREVGPEMKKKFERAFAQSTKHGWKWGTHYLRKCYACASFEVYESKIKEVSNRWVDKSVYLASVLGHMGSAKTSLSYSNIKIIISYPASVFDIPSAELLRNLVAEVKSLRKLITDSMTETKKEVAKIAVEMPPKSDMVTFTNKENTIIHLDRRTKKAYSGEADKVQEVQKSIELLVEHKINPSINNIMQLGFGRPTVSKTIKLLPLEMQKLVEDAGKQEPKVKKPHIPPPVIIPPSTSTTSTTSSTTSTTTSTDEVDFKHHDGSSYVAPKPSKKAKTTKEPKHLLAHGIRVIVPQDGSVAANREIARRDTEYYGADNILLDPKDCTGVIVPKQKHGPKRIRDECHETE